jgi:hypothetical protein
MFDIFTNDPVSARPLSQPGYLSNNQIKMRKSLDRIVRHLRNRHWYVYSSHILVKILTSIPVDRDLDIFEYHKKVEAIAYDLGKTLGISSSLHKSISKDSYMLGDDVTEIYVAINEPIDLLTVESNWEELEPIKFLRHDVDSLDLTPLDGRRSEEFGLAVIQVDIVKLAIQYRSWIKHWEESGVDEIPSVVNFVAGHPTANALYSFYDHCIYNRFRTRLEGKVPSTKVTKLTFSTPSYTDEVDKYIKYTINRIERAGGFTFDQMLQQLELVTVKDAFNLTRLPQLFISRQVEWVILISRLETLIYLVQTGDMFGHNSKNRVNLNKIKIYVKSLRGTRIFSNTLSTLDERAILRDINVELKPYI